MIQASKQIVEGAYKLSLANTTPQSVDGNEDVSLCLLSCFSFMAKTSQLKEYYELYQHVSKNLVVDVILPRLVLSEAEENHFIENEVEFVNYSFDLCFD